MANRGLPISTFVKIATQIVAGGILRTEYGAGLLVTTEAGIPAGGVGKIRRYADIEAVQSDFATGEALAAARVWFGGDAEPHALFIGRWATADVATIATGTWPGTVAMAPLNASNASFSVNGSDVVGVDLSGVSTYAGIATAVAAAIVALGGIFAGATFTYEATANNGSGGFVLTIDGDGSLANDGAFAAHSAGTGTDISAALGFTIPVYAQGHDTETLDAALAEMLPQSTASVNGAQASGGSPTLPMVDGSCPAIVGTVDTRESLADYVQAGDYFAFIRDNGADALATSGTFRHYVFAQQLSDVEAVVGAGMNFGSGTNYIDVAANSFLSSQRFNLPASIKNPHLKSMPGATAILVDGDQLADLVATRTSVYTIVGGLPSLAGGYTGKAGVWADAQYWLGWLKNELEINIFNAQRGSDRFATALLTDTINDVMATAERSGGLGPGARVNDAVRNQIRRTFSRPDFDGILPNGWIPWIEQPHSRSDLDRENRVGRFSGSGSRLPMR